MVLYIYIGTDTRKIYIYELWEEFKIDVTTKAPKDNRFEDAPYIAARFVAYLTRTMWEEDSYGLGIGIVNNYSDYGQCYTYKVENGSLQKI